MARRLAPAGWASGGKPTSPASQISADEAHAAADCAANTLLLFRIRGSGEVAGSTKDDSTNDRLGAWTFAAGEAAIKKGWRVRDMQGDYPAPSLPALTTVIRDPVALKRYRDVATTWWPSMKATLVAAYNRCPQRTIMISGYSQGALILRYLTRNLPTAVRDQIAQVDLLGDPTADTEADGHLQHPASLGGRLTNGVDTQVARITHAGFFRQTPYPSDIAPRTVQYCLPNDWVCDFNPVSILRAGRQAHQHYNWGSIGRQAATSLMTWSSTVNATLPNCGTASYGLLSAPTSWDPGCTGGSPKFSNLRWTDWGMSEATARGDVTVRNCVPNGCILSTFDKYKTIVVVYALVPCKGTRMYSQARITFAGSRTYTQPLQCGS